MVDILLAVYNGEKYIKQQLDSIIAQTFKDWRLIVYDDGSCDDTAQILKDYILKYKGRIVFYKGLNNSKSAVFSFSKLLKLSSAKYVAFCDHDDVWHKDRLTFSVEAMKDMELKYGDIPILIHTDLYIVDEFLKIKNKSMIKSQCLGFKAKSLQELIVQNNITGCTVLVNRSLVNICGNIPSSALMHDWWLGLVAASFGKIKFLNAKTVYYRQHSSNCVGAKNVRSFSYIFGRIFGKSAVKRSIDNVFLQCEAFLNIYGALLPKDKKKILEDYISINRFSKLRRIAKLIVGGYLKFGFFRKLGQFFYICIKV